jgi:hypothetical protein
MLKKQVLSLLGGFVSFASFAGTMGISPPPPSPMVEVHPWSVTASLGYTSYKYGADGTGQTPIGRFAIGKAFCDLGQSSFGAEIGVQNGNAMRLFIDPTDLNLLAGLPIDAHVKPMLDLLATLRISLAQNVPLFLDIKGGIVYRRMYLDQDNINNKSQFGGEFQGGIGMPIADSSTLSVLYQGVYGGSLGYSVNPVSLNGSIKNIPVQNGILLSLNISL